MNCPNRERPAHCTCLSLSFFATMCYMQVLNRCIKAARVFRASPYSWGVHKHLTGATLPHLEVSYRLGFPLGCLFSKVHFFGLLAGSQILGSQPPLKLPRCNLKQSPYSCGTRGGGRKRQTSPHWQVAILMIQGTYLQGLTWIATQWVVFHTHLPNLKVSIEGPNRVVIYMVQRVSTHFYLKIVPLGQFLGAGQARRMHILRIRMEGGASKCLGSALRPTGGHIFLVTCPSKALIPTSIL